MCSRLLENVCAKLKVDPLSRFRTGARQVFNTQKLFPSENCNIKFSVNTFSDQITICQILLKFLTSNKSILEQKSKYLNSIKVFPFFQQEGSKKQSPQPVTLLNKRLCHRRFPVHSAKFTRTPFLTEHFQWLLLKDGKL